MRRRKIDLRIISEAISLLLLQILIQEPVKAQAIVEQPKSRDCSLEWNRHNILGKVLESSDPVSVSLRCNSQLIDIGIAENVRLGYNAASDSYLLVVQGVNGAQVIRVSGKDSLGRRVVSDIVSRGSIGIGSRLIVSIDKFEISGVISITRIAGP